MTGSVPHSCLDWSSWTLTIQELATRSLTPRVPQLIWISHPPVHNCYVFCREQLSPRGRGLLLNPRWPRPTYYNTLWRRLVFCCCLHDKRDAEQRRCRRRGRQTGAPRRGGGRLRYPLSQRQRPPGQPPRPPQPPASPPSLPPARRRPHPSASCASCSPPGRAHPPRHDPAHLPLPPGPRALPLEEAR